MYSPLAAQVYHDGPAMGVASAIFRTMLQGLPTRVTNEQRGLKHNAHAPLDKGLTGRKLNGRIVAGRLDLVVTKDFEHLFVRAVCAELRAN